MGDCHADDIQEADSKQKNILYKLYIQMLKKQICTSHSIPKELR